MTKYELSLIREHIDAVINKWEDAYTVLEHGANLTPELVCQLGNLTAGQYQHRHITLGLTDLELALGLNQMEAKKFRAQAEERIKKEQARAKAEADYKALIAAGVTEFLASQVTGYCPDHSKDAQTQA